MVREYVCPTQRIWRLNFLQTDVTRCHSFALMGIGLLFAPTARTLAVNR